MAARYSLSPEAKRDFVAIKNYYIEKADAKVARRVVDEITRALKFLAMTPGAGHVRTDLTNEPVRFWPVFAYLIVYDPTTTPIGVSRVVHGGRDLETLFLERPPRIPRSS